MKYYNPLLFLAPLSHLTSCTPTKSNLHLATSMGAAVSEPALYRLITFLWRGVVSTLSNSRPGEPLLFSCAKILIQYTPAFYITIPPEIIILLCQGRYNKIFRTSQCVRGQNVSSGTILCNS